MSTSLNKQRSLAVVLVYAALLCLPWLERPFHTRGEPREALVAQAMLSTGNWISPPAYDGAVPSKPPFSHWLMALCSLVRGEVTEATARLPSALAFVFFISGFFLFVEKRSSVRTALTASLIVLSSSEWFRAATTCRVDTVLATSMAGALLALYAWWERGYKGIPVSALALVSCATLTKGPIGFVLPVGIFSFFCWLKSGCAPLKLVGVVGRAVALVLPVMAIASLWYVLGYLQRGDAFLDKVMYENFDRFTSTMADEPHKHSALYLVGMLLIGLLPWTLVCGIGMYSRGRFRTTLQAMKSAWSDLPDMLQFAAITSGAIFLFFCIPSSKRSVYLLPAYPFMGLLLAYVLKDGAPRVARICFVVRRVLLVLTLATLVFGVLALMFSIPGIHVRLHAMLQCMTVWKLVSSALLLGILLWPLRAATLELMAGPIEQVAGAVMFAVFLISFFIYDPIAWQLSPKEWVKSPEFQRVLIREQGKEFFSFGSESYGASFYMQKPFSRGDEKSLSEGAVVLVEARRLEAFVAMHGDRAHEIFRYQSGIGGTKQDIVVMRVKGTDS